MTEQKKSTSVPKTTNKSGIQTVPKHNSTIHISSEASFTARKIMNALLFQAYDYLPVREKHEINIGVLGALIGFDSKDTNLLKVALEELTKSTVKWNILEDDKTEVWSISTLLASAEIRRGVCTFSYSPVLREHLYDPEKWTRINLAIQRRFSSAYALILYENCVRFRSLKATGFWDIDDFRTLLGVSDIKSYKAFRVLNDKVIKPAVREVNKFSDIIIEPFFEKNGRKVVAVSFTIRENKQTSLLKISEDSEVSETEVYKELRKRGMSHTFASMASLDFEESYVFEQLTIADEYASRSEITGTKQGLIRKAITEGYSKPDKIVRAERRQEAEKNKLRIEKIEFQIEEQKGKLKTIERQYREFFLDFVVKVFDNMDREEQDHVLSDFQSKYDLSSFMLRDFKTHAWSSYMNWSNIRQYWLEVRSLPCPTYDEFSKKRGIVEIEAKIAKLEASL